MMNEVYCCITLSLCFYPSTMLLNTPFLRMCDSIVKIYGKISRRQAIAKLRENTTSDPWDRGSPSVGEPENCCALTDIMVNQAVEMHKQRRLGGLHASRFKIASDTHNVSLIKLDVEKVSEMSFQAAG